MVERTENPKPQEQNGKQSLEDLRDSINSRTSVPDEPAITPPPRDPLQQALKEQELFQNVISKLTEQAPEAIIDRAQQKLDNLTEFTSKVEKDLAAITELIESLRASISNNVYTKENTQGFLTERE